MHVWHCKHFRCALWNPEPLFNSEPPILLLPGHFSRCNVRIKVQRFVRGRVALKAATLSAPLPGNQSVRTDTLYHLAAKQHRE